MYCFSFPGMTARDLGRVMNVCKRGWAGFLSWRCASNKLVFHSSLYDSECFLHFRVWSVSQLGSSVMVSWGVILGKCWWMAGDLELFSSSCITWAAAASVGGGLSAEMPESSAEFSRTLSICHLSSGICRRIICVGTSGAYNDTFVYNHTLPAASLGCQGLGWGGRGVCTHWWQGKNGIENGRKISTWCNRYGRDLCQWRRIGGGWVFP